MTDSPSKKPPELTILPPDGQVSAENLMVMTRKEEVRRIIQPSSSQPHLPPPGPSSSSGTIFETGGAATLKGGGSHQLQPPPLGRRPVSAMASLPWSLIYPRVSYQLPRDDPADDDEDCAVESTLFLSTSPASFHSPHAGGSATSLALSPPGLSPLNFNDGSPFSVSSTPSSTSSLANRRAEINRFTFDHIPFIGATSSSTNATPSTASTGFTTSSIPSNCSPSTSKKNEPEKSAFDVVSTHQNPNEILKRVRLGASCSSVTTGSSRTSQSVSESGENKQYFCQMCKKDFKRPDILSRHLRRHTGEKPFGCEDCGRFFSRSDHLRTHRRTHTDEKPYQCSICSYSARRRDVLTRHMATRHQANPPEPGTHRNVRRCFSDGEYHKMTAQGIRQRHLGNAHEPQEEGDDEEIVVVVDDEPDQIPKMEDIEDDVIIDDI